MGAILDEASVVFRDYELAGVPISGAHRPIKSEIRALFGSIDNRVPFVEDWDPTASGADADYSQIQAALDGVSAAGGGELWMRAKTYNCSFAPQIPAKVQLRGQGIDVTTINATGTDPSILRTKDAPGLYGVGYLSASGMTLDGTPAQLYGFLGRGMAISQLNRIKVVGLSATTGSGWDGSQAAWGFYFTSFIDSTSVNRKSTDNIFTNLITKDSPNSFNLATPTNTAIDGSGGLNNTLMGAIFTNFINTGMELFGEASVISSVNLSAAVDNTVGVRVHDAVTTLIGIDADSTFGPTAGAGTDAWGYPLGVRQNNNVGIYFYDTCSCICFPIVGNGPRKRIDFESITARSKVVLLGTGFTSISDTVTGIPQKAAAPTTDYTLKIGDMGQTVRMNSTAANALTVPPHSAVPFPTGARVEVYQYNTGATTITAGAGVTLFKVASLVSPGRWYRALLHQVLTDVWTVNWLA